LKRKEELKRQLENLGKQSSSGKISVAVSLKLRGELEGELRKNEEEFVQKIKKESEDTKSEIKAVEVETSRLENKRNELAKSLEELEARFRIEQIDKKDYETRSAPLEQQIVELDKNIGSNKTRIEKLTAQLKLNAQILEDTQKNS
jgi:chromosome segregation ATPase